MDTTTVIMIMDMIMDTIMAIRMDILILTPTTLIPMTLTPTPDLAITVIRNSPQFSTMTIHIHIHMVAIRMITKT